MLPPPPPPGLSLPDNHKRITVFYFKSTFLVRKLLSRSFAVPTAKTECYALWCVW